MSEADTSTEANEEPSPIELDEAMIAYIEKIVYKIADKLFDKRVDREELIQKIFLRYLEKPPIWNPSKGASKETFVYGMASGRGW
jgi:DNA-directed RNA polymerase specialized sigma24 family protein